ncbi:MAG TPA: glycosyltransferase [Blastocatellia bacterium]|nr:glycosyltransferase [Blastocatellia bacterium]
MRIVFVADARSAISKSWIAHFVSRGDDVHVISTYPCADDIIGGARVYQLPVAFAGFSRISHNGTVASKRQPSLLARGLAGLRIGALSSLSSAARFWLGPVELNRFVTRARDLIASISPDLVHALRIPFEGIVAAKATPAAYPLLISVWGNDFTLCAGRSPLMSRQTRQTLERADALLCDCRRDLTLAERDWGFDRRKPSALLPGAGGIHTSIFNPDGDRSELRKSLKIPVDAPVIINPRGFRGYVRNDIFFQSIPLVLEKHPRTVFLCIGMEGNPVAEKWVKRLGVSDSVRLLPAVAHNEMAQLFRLADVTVSPSLHDGTPNSLLEAMACGCFPVAGDIESVREWIVDGENGLLCDATDKHSVGRALERALDEGALRDRAREHNVSLVAERADYGRVMREAEDFYRRVISQTGRAAKV